MPSIEEHIKKAMGEGKFDDLPGKGKPLNLDNNPHADPDWRLAHHVLHSSGYTLPWIALRQEIERELEASRSALQRAWEWHKGAVSQSQPAKGKAAANTAADEWQRAQDAFDKKIKQINKQIDDYNMQTPSEKFQMMKIKPERELAAVTKAD